MERIGGVYEAINKETSQRKGVEGEGRGKGRQGKGRSCWDKRNDEEGGRRDGGKSGRARVWGKTR